jgi:branched-chain amino acid aminotransferase
MGTGAMGLGATSNPIRVAIAVWEWGAYLGEEGLKNGIRCKVSSFTRHHVNVSMVKGKIIGQYVNSILAKREALKSGYQEAILLDDNGYVTEGSGENLFMVRDGVLRTAPYSSSILGGITRDSVIQLAREMDIVVQELAFSRDELYTADEVFMCGTAAEITPVREVDDRAIGQGRPGPITERLQDRFFDIVKGTATDHNEWLDWL